MTDVTRRRRHPLEVKELHDTELLGKRTFLAFIYLGSLPCSAEKTIRIFMVLSEELQNGGNIGGKRDCSEITRNILGVYHVSS